MKFSASTLHFDKKKFSEILFRNLINREKKFPRNYIVMFSDVFFFFFSALWKSLYEYTSLYDNTQIKCFRLPSLKNAWDLRAQNSMSAINFSFSPNIFIGWSNLHQNFTQLFSFKKPNLRSSHW